VVDIDDIKEEFDIGKIIELLELGVSPFAEFNRFEWAKLPCIILILEDIEGGGKLLNWKFESFFESNLIKLWFILGVNADGEGEVKLIFGVVISCLLLITKIFEGLLLGGKWTSWFSSFLFFNKFSLPLLSFLFFFFNLVWVFLLSNFFVNFPFLLFVIGVGVTVIISLLERDEEEEEW